MQCNLDYLIISNPVLSSQCKHMKHTSLRKNYGEVK